MPSFRKEIRGKYTAKRVTKQDLEGNRRPRSSARDEDVEGADKPVTRAKFTGGLGLITPVVRPRLRQYVK
jgi:hypothetical protein